MQLFNSCIPCCWTLLMAPAWQVSPQLSGGRTAGHPLTTFTTCSGFRNPGKFISLSGFPNLGTFITLSGCPNLSTFITLSEITKPGTSMTLLGFTNPGTFITLSGFSQPWHFHHSVWAMDVILFLSLSLATTTQLAQATSLDLGMYTLDLRCVHNKKLPWLA